MYKISHRSTYVYMNTFDLTYAYITIIYLHNHSNVEKGVVEKGGLINSQEPIYAYVKKLKNR